MTDYQPGEIVEITIRGARVDRLDSAKNQRFMVGDDDELWLALPLSEAVTIERFAPAEWPPQPGDVWLDRDGNPWFGCWYCLDPDSPDPAWVPFVDSDGAAIAVLNQTAGPMGAGPERPEWLVQQRGPLTLAYRKPATTGGAA